MNVMITGRHLEVTPALRNYALEKMKRMDKYNSKIMEVNVILSVEKYRHTAEVTLSAGGTRINGKEVTADMYTSIDKVAEKVERQLRKHKEKVSSHSLRENLHDRLIEASEDEAMEIASAVGEA